MVERNHGAAALAVLFAAAAGALWPGSAYCGGLYSPPPPPVYDAGPVVPQSLFGGWWLGGTLGGASSTVDLSKGSSDLSGSGMIGGVTGGYNLQRGRMVLGVEGDVLSEDVTGDQRFGNGHYDATSDLGTTGDLRLRAGVAVMPQLLVFGTLGGSIASGDFTVTGPGGGGKNDSTLVGWNAGGGAEVALGQHWGARFDYQFTDFGSETVNYGGGKQTFDPDTSTYRGSVIYRF